MRRATLELNLEVLRVSYFRELDPESHLCVSFLFQTGEGAWILLWSVVIRYLALIEVFFSLIVSAGDKKEEWVYQSSSDHAVFLVLLS